MNVSTKFSDEKTMTWNWKSFLDYELLKKFYTTARSEESNQIHSIIIVFVKYMYFYTEGKIILLLLTK